MRWGDTVIQPVLPLVFHSNGSGIISIYLGHGRMPETRILVVGDIFTGPTRFCYKNGQGTYYQIKEKSVGQLQSDRKTSPYHRATEENPKFIAENDGTSTPRSFRITPASNLTTISIDYVRTPPHEIDVTDNSTTLEDYYPNKFLYRLMDECVSNFGIQTKDYNTSQAAKQDIIENP